jgi:hypothetical protein
MFAKRKNHFERPPLKRGLHNFDSMEAFSTSEVTRFSADLPTSDDPTFRDLLAAFGAEGAAEFAASGYRTTASTGQ